jgi:hypothetical protein
MVKSLAVACKIKATGPDGKHGTLEQRLYDKGVGSGHPWSTVGMIPIVAEDGKAMGSYTDDLCNWTR